jgi:uncharacterized membrane protein (UPF0182 family)
MRRPSLPGLLFLGVALLFLIPSSVTYYTDWLWFRELGYEHVFVRTLNAQLMVFVAAFAIAFLFLFFNLRIARRGINRSHVVVGRGPDGRAIAIETGPIAGLALPVAVVVALGIGVVSARNWLEWLTYFNAESFGQTDALFGRDVSFYVFSLPVLQAVQQQALLLSMLALVGCGVYYVLSGSFVIEPGAGGFWPRMRLVTSARRHLGLLGALVFALLAWGSWFGVPNTLLTPANIIFGASYVDVYARLPLIWISIAVLSAGVILALVYGFTSKAWPIPLALGLWIVISMGGGLYSAAVQNFVVNPDELNREQPYIVHNIAATRTAYALNRVEEREISGDAELSAKDIIANASTIENVRLWDHQPLLETFAQLQELRTYYDFTSVDNDRYQIDGQYRQVMLSVRELDTTGMQSRSWVSDRLTFTHGYGLTLGPVNQVTTEGSPVLFIRDLPPVTTAGLKVTEPSIYFGELSSNYVLVRTKQKEFHYPKGDDNVETFYEGSGGVPIGGFLRRLLFAIRFAATDILFTNQLTPESRILFHRKITDRVQVLAPFLSFDADPYPVLADGRIFWIQDAYTVSANYPYSTPAAFQGQSVNYIRNSVKIVIDAFHGTTNFYLADSEDAIARTLNRVFPGMLKPIAEMPPDLRAHMRYPEDIFRIQAAVYQNYHMTNPQVFFIKEDQWQVPTIDEERGSVPMEPYYTVMRLPGETRTEFVQMLPYTPRQKENLAAWIVARSDGEHYGKMLVFQFPKQKIIFGPKQVVGRINQDQRIAPEITLWSQQRSRVIWGTLLVIPVNESLLYVRPLYLKSPEGRIPELKRVVVAYQNRIEMAETLTQALARIFGPTILQSLAQDRLGSDPALAKIDIEEPDSLLPAGTPGATPAAAGTVGALVAEMTAQFDAADKALAARDFAAYGEAMKKARQALERLQKLAIKK